MIKKNSATGKTFYGDFFALLITIGLFYLLFLGSHGLISPDEGRYSDAAREMLVTGNFITPHVDGVPFLDKPILFYWLQALSMVLFGINEWSIRLFPMLAGVGNCLLVYVIGNKLFGRRSGLLSALILSVMPMFFGVAHFANMDIEVAFFITGAVGCGLIAIDQADSTAGRHWMWLAFVFAGLGFLTKGLIAIVFPMMILGVWIIGWNRWKYIPKLSLPISILIFLAIVLPWFIVVSLNNPTFLHYFFIYEQFTRFIGDQFNSTQPVWYYLMLILAGIAPWIWFFGQSIKMHWLQVKHKEPRNHRSAILLLWPLLILIFFSIPASKLPGYIAPVFPPLALLLGTYLDTRFASSCWRKAFWSVFLVFAVALVAVMGCMRWFPINTDQTLTAVVRHQIQPTDQVVSYENYFWGVPLYLQRQVLVVGQWNDVHKIMSNDGWPQMFYMGVQQDPKAKKWLLDEEQFWSLWCSTQRVWVFARADALNNFAQHDCAYTVVSRADRKVVLLNHY